MSAESKAHAARDAQMLQIGKLAECGGNTASELVRPKASAHLSMHECRLPSAEVVTDEQCDQGCEGAQR
jgi:hypothetical protein